VTASIEPFVANVLAFGRILRQAGLRVHHTRLLDAVRALQWVDIGNREDVRVTLLALLVQRHEDMATFDTAFRLFFRDHARSTSHLALFSLGERPRVIVKPQPGLATAIEFEDLHADDGTTERSVGAYSATAVSRTKDFADFSSAELDAARRLLKELPWRLGQRRTRRWQRRGRAAVDLRRALRRAHGSGELLDLPYRTRRKVPRPVVFIGDVSGSMERYSRVLLHFVYGMARHIRHVESFVFSTTLTRVTHRVAQRGSERAITQVVRDVEDWGGGTRIGDSLRQFNTQWARRAMRHGPVVILVSDGWDRGDPEVLRKEMARLKRSCHRLIWLNPLLGSATYEPLTRGMQAALPYVDDFLPAHNLVSLEQLARHLAN
jgi:uncharacterized protein with von Willebrand factor type A (vWA) domain